MMSEWDEVSDYIASLNEDELMALVEEDSLVECDDLAPDKVFINQEWVDAMTGLSDEQLKFINSKAETEEEFLTGFATLSYCAWKKRASISQIILAVTFFESYYQGVMDLRMDEFLAKLRLGERVGVEKEGLDFMGDVE